MTSRHYLNDTKEADILNRVDCLSMGVKLWVFNTAIYGKMYGVPLILLNSVCFRANNKKNIYPC